ncbi:MAG: cell division protein ZapA [Myxococcales bacterium]|nr:cell division protein ZapA [Myxococcales bacterium]MCB9531708.1 cell division protein ZapA [Myxococcales bacterium]
MVRSVTLHVAGQKLSIRTDASDAELTELVQEVTNRVRDVQSASMTATQAKVFLLTALSLADELRQARAELARVRDAVTLHAQGALSFTDSDAPT